MLITLIITNLQPKLIAMIKVEKSNQNINPFGGINFVIDAINNYGIAEQIDNQLGDRPAQAEYSYSEVFKSLWSIFFCGGDCAEDLNVHLNDFLKNTAGLKLPNADTVLRVLKNLKTEKETVISTAGKSYETNKHNQLNQLCINLLKHTGQLNETEYYDYDFDNEVLKTEKFDTKKSYKMVNGYFPGMSTINGMPIYLENRDGNMNVKTEQDELLTRSYKILKDSNIHINRSRMDAGSYTKKIVTVVEENSQLFYIRANRCDALTNMLLEPREWEKVEINHIEYEVCSIEYQPFSYKKDEEPKTYRLVVMRRKKKGSLQLDLFSGDNMEYRSILTNDRQSTEKEVIEYYNQRGTEEKTIDILNNDFGWSKMPFSFMEENTVFLIVMMICKNIYTWLIEKFSKEFSGLKKNFRIKKFIFRFITVPAKWIKRGRRMILKIYSDKPYHLLPT